MAFSVRRVSVAAALVALLPIVAAAQDPTTIRGRVTAEGAATLPGVAIAIPELGLGAITRDDGTYSISIPAGRVSGQSVTLTARRVGYKPKSARITLASGSATQDFTLEANPLQLGEVVVTGAGTATEVEKLGSVRNTVQAELIQKSNETNIVSALSGKAPNVQITTTSGDPGASASIRIRGLRTLSSNGQPLFVIDGIPIDNSAQSTTAFNVVDEPANAESEGATFPNRAIDINPNDIENVEILKGPAAAAIYGARAANGVILITTKHGGPGRTSYALRSSYSSDRVTRFMPLQRSWGQGLGGVAAGDCEDPASQPQCLRSWGPRVSSETFDHAREAFRDGHISDNNLSVTGGNDRTAFFLSGGYNANNGVFVGPNNFFDRASVRLNASHDVMQGLQVGGNFAYSDTKGHFTQRGNNVNGLLLGLFRTPPTFNNLPYLDATSGLHRSYRMQNPDPTTAGLDRGFNNPFYTLYGQLNQAEATREFGNITASYLANNWLKFNYSLGADYSNDERLEGCGPEASDVCSGGRVTEGKIVNYQIDHNLTATANYHVNDHFAGTVTLGQNLNARNSRQLGVVGRTLVAPEPFNLGNTVVRDLPYSVLTQIHNESYFGQGTFDLFNQLFLTAALRNDGSSTFGPEHRRNWFPKGSVAWNFTNAFTAPRWLSFGKLRMSYGEAGQEPTPYLTSTIFNGTVLLGGISQGTGNSPTQAGLGGLATSNVKGAEDLRPERTKETEGGIDLGLFNQAADLSLTFYNAISQDVILVTPLAPSSGFFVQAQNSGKFQNRGIEVSANLRAITRPNLTWEVGGGWAKNVSKVVDLAGVDYIPLDGTFNQTPYNVAKQGLPLGTYYDYGFVKCGVSPEGPDAAIEGVDLKDVCANKPKGALYIGANGFPVGDDNIRVIGDPNPKWTGNARTSLRYKKLTVSGLLDLRHGGQVYNGTKSALYSYGTHMDTENRATCDESGLVCTGNEKTFGQNGWFDGPVVGPGAGKAVAIGENWYRRGLGPCAFTGYNESCLEDASYVKLREISAGYTFDGPWVQRALGLSSVDVRLAGRNLKTWAKYTGLDPETNAGGSVQRTQGIDYFNLPQTRSVVLSVGLNR
jgi:TonB-linked SusC/RagA family outer membrane protein